VRRDHHSYNNYGENNDEESFDNMKLPLILINSNSVVLDNNGGGRLIPRGDRNHALPLGEIMANHYL